MIHLAAVKLEKKERDFVLEYKEKALHRERLPLIFGRQDEIKARLRNISTRIDWLEDFIPKAKDELEGLKGKTDSKSVEKARDLTEEIPSLVREMSSLKGLLDEYAEKEKKIYKPRLHETAAEILKAMGVKPGYWARRKMAFALENGIPMDKGRLEYGRRRLLKLRRERTAEGEAIPDCIRSEEPGRSRVISIWHPNKEVIYMDATGKNIVCVANALGIMHYHKPASDKATVDFTTFRPKETIRRKRFEEMLEKAEEGLRADVMKAYEQLEAQKPVYIEARTT